MPIKNYTTKISAVQTASEIQVYLALHGASKVMMDYKEGKVQSVSFAIETSRGLQGVKLPANVDRVFAVLKKQKVKCDLDQAERVAWRIVKDWIEAQMAILETEMVQMEEIFLPYFVSNSGQTLFEVYQQGQLQIGGRE